MPNSKILTLSIAAYNVDSFLNRTLDSIIQSHYLQSIEAIVVNDGSNDGTLELAKKYEERFPECIRVLDKENGGYGSTINASISAASGKYYKLIDGDDWVDSAELDALIESLVGLEADMVVTKYTSVRGQQEKTVELNWPYDGKVLPIEQRLAYTYAMHMLAFKTHLLKNIIQQYPITEHAYYTDFEFLVKGISGCKSVVLVDANVYQYRLGRSGQSVSLKSWFSHIDSACEVTLGVTRYYDQVIKDNDEVCFQVKQWALEQCAGSAAYKCKLLLMMGCKKNNLFKLLTFLDKLKASCPDVFEETVQKVPSINRIIQGGSVNYYLSALPQTVRARIQILRGR